MLAARLRHSMAFWLCLLPEDDLWTTHGSRPALIALHSYLTIPYVPALSHSSKIGGLICKPVCKHCVKPARQQSCRRFAPELSPGYLAGLGYAEHIICVPVSSFRILGSALYISDSSQLTPSTSVSFIMPAGHIATWRKRINEASFFNLQATVLRARKARGISQNAAVGFITSTRHCWCGLEHWDPESCLPVGPIQDITSSASSPFENHSMQNHQTMQCIYHVVQSEIYPVISDERTHLFDSPDIFCCTQLVRLIKVGITNYVQTAGEPQVLPYTFLPC